MFIQVLFQLIIVPTGAPLNLAANANGSRAISLAWDLPEPEKQNGVIVGYLVRIIPIIGGQTMDYETEGYYLLIGDLLPHTTYECVVAATTEVGTGPFSGIVTVQTMEEGLQLHFMSSSMHINTIFSAPSGHPSNSSGIALNSTHIHLMWDPPPLNVTHGDIQEYRIAIVEYETSNVEVYTSEITELVVGPLHPYYTYNCSIQAVTVEPGPPIIILVRTQEAGSYLNYVFVCL